MSNALEYFAAFLSGGLVTLTSFGWSISKSNERLLAEREDLKYRIFMLEAACRNVYAEAAAALKEKE